MKYRGKLIEELSREELIEALKNTTRVIDDLLNQKTHERKTLLELSRRK